MERRGSRGLKYKRNKKQAGKGQRKLGMEEDEKNEEEEEGEEENKEEETEEKRKNNKKKCLRYAV